MKKVLYVGAGAPWLGGAGYLVRQATTLRALAQIADLHLALFELPPEAPPPPYGQTVTPLVFRQMEAGGKVRAGLADLFNPLPRLLRNVDLPTARAPLVGLDLTHFDAVVAYRIDFAHAAGALGRPRLILDVDDPEHLRWRRRMEAQGAAIDWRTARDLEKLKRFERSAVAGAAQAWVCQENDRAAFSRGNLVVVPNGVRVPPRAQRRATGPVVLLLGNFAPGAGSPNADALRWFAGEVWPKVRALAPDAECRVVGKINDELRVLVSAVGGMRALGFVDSLAGAFAEARLSVAPLRFGTGTRVKILDAWAHACPVVSTTAGADGLPAAPGENILIADDPGHFAARCAELLRDAPRAAVIGAAGHRTAAAHFDAAAIESRLADLFRNFLAPERR
ncbi:MAG TPA: glycosyltransferase [Phycisphaerae bacterium]|nr:glycosyltransferase [Phycisphaerae bacterium]